MRATTGLVYPKDLPRLLVVDKLEGAREIRFISRRDVDVNDGATMVWGDPRFHE
jgi:hypothetical protein